MAESVRVILAPDVFARAFMEPASKAVLDFWRDGKVTPVITWDLLQRYLRLLRKCGLPGDALRKWTMWFTARGKTACLLEPRACEATPQEGIARAVEAGCPAAVISCFPPDEACAGVPWLTPEAFVTEWTRLAQS